MTKNPLPILRTLYRIYQATNDQASKDDLKQKMHECLSNVGENFTFLFPKGEDTEYLEIMQLLGYTIENKKPKYTAIVVYKTDTDFEYIETEDCYTLEETELFFELHENDKNFSHTHVEPYSE